MVKLIYIIVYNCRNYYFLLNLSNHYIVNVQVSLKNVVNLNEKMVNYFFSFQLLVDQKSINKVTFFHISTKYVVSKK